MMRLKFGALVLAGMLGVTPVPGPVLAASADCPGVQGQLESYHAERRELEKEIEALENLLQRAQAALAESLDTDIVEDVMNLFSDEPPGQGLDELIQLVSTELRNRMTRLKVMQDQIKQALQELQECQRRLLEDGLAGRRAGKRTSVQFPASLSEQSPSSSSPETEYRPPGPPIGLGDGGTD